MRCVLGLSRRGEALETVLPRELCFTAHASLVALLGARPSGSNSLGAGAGQILHGCYSTVSITRACRN